MVYFPTMPLGQGASLATALATAYGNCAGSGAQVKRQEAH